MNRETAAALSKASEAFNLMDYDGNGDPFIGCLIIGILETLKYYHHLNMLLEADSW